MTKLTNLADVRKVARQTGNHFFDRETMRHWNSRICDSLTRTLYDGRVWFITSEKMPDDGEGNTFPRLYKVRRAMMIDNRLLIDTIGGEHESSKVAYRAMVLAMGEGK